ncbi:DNA transposase THAP9 [Dissostichus eleginoides]|uniref:DNA transposase THAP9 n=1 Tax=Dissostichus eleginoides TaxID=100907 RepID=A0AAD9F7K0_DISEL|nr:DNA transposase THAP9 [Dissostichus eleginoides]
MLKLLRNVFSTVGVLVREDGQQIMWKYIEELHKLQEKEGLRLGNKLKMAHIQWRNPKMKVNLAAQLFSSSVADAVEYSEKELKYPQFTGSAATVQFLRTIDAAFEVFNSRNQLGRGHKAPIKPATKHRAIGILEEAESLLRGLKVKGKDNKRVPLHATQKKTPICGFIACGRSVIGIYEDLVEQPAAPCRYLLTYKLSQDHLELFFSAIRARGGYNNKPNVRQFRGAYKRLLVRHQVKKGTGNCLLRDNTTILDSTPANINMARRLGIEPVEEIVTEDDTLANLPDVNHLSEYKEAAISYIAGFIVKKIEQKVTCMPCSYALTSADSVHPFVTLKNRGGLQKPSPGITSVCQVTERCFQRLLNANEGKAPQGRGTTAAIVHQVLSECSEKNPFPQLHNHMFDMCVEANHVHVLVKMASALYCKVRLNHIARRQTDKIKEGKVVRRKLTKLINFYGE